MSNRSSKEMRGGLPADQRPIECTAVLVDGEPRPNILFTPPCTCSRCAPDPTDISADRATDNWLRISGSRQRLRVENVELGAAGRAVLG